MPFRARRADLPPPVRPGPFPCKVCFVWGKEWTSPFRHTCLSLPGVSVSWWRRCRRAAGRPSPGTTSGDSARPVRLGPPRLRPRRRGTSSVWSGAASLSGPLRRVGDASPCPRRPCGRVTDFTVPGRTRTSSAPLGRRSVAADGIRPGRPHRASARGSVAPPLDLPIPSPVPDG